MTVVLGIKVSDKNREEVTFLSSVSITGEKEVRPRVYIILGQIINLELIIIARSNRTLLEDSSGKVAMYLQVEITERHQTNGVPLLQSLLWLIS